eukprot:7626636-Lingulodinium_polyedra.AAC.1
MHLRGAGPCAVSEAPDPLLEAMPAGFYRRRLFAKVVAPEPAPLDSENDAAGEAQITMAKETGEPEPITDGARP